jgi:hypothetical protein
LTDIDELTPVLLVWDSTLGSPPELQSRGGLVVAVPPEFMPLPDRGVLVGLGGYARRDGTGGWQWVLQGEVDPLDQFVDSLTGLGLWKNQNARTAVKTLISRLFSAGIPRQTIATQFPQVYAAIAAEIASEQAAQ